MSTKVERNYWLSVREQMAVKMMSEHKPVAHIAAALGLDWDNARKLLPEWAENHGIDYHPNRAGMPFNRLGDANRLARRRMADLLYMLRQHRHRVEIAIATGIGQREQLRAVNPPYNHDWSWGQMTGLASLLDVTYGELTIALDEEESLWLRWLNGRADAQWRSKALSAA